jgi:hypothetical protein
MDFIGATITAIKTIVGAVYPPLKKKYFDQPKIYFIFKYENSMKAPRGLSPVNDTSKPIDIMSAIYLNDLSWNYKLTLRNNSEYPAYNIRLIQPQTGQGFRLAEKIDALKPILPNAEIEYKSKFYEFYEGLGKIASDKVEKTPDFLLNQKLFLNIPTLKGQNFIQNLLEVEQKSDAMIS